jgi:predicted transcriptional regulator
MKLTKIIELVEGRILTKNVDLDREIQGGCGADLMSDVLASTHAISLLLTGLCNPQVVRTAVMADISAIILVRGKNPPEETINLAEAEDIPLISSPYGMFETCGRLYQAGLPSLEKNISSCCECDD